MRRAVCGVLSVGIVGIVVVATIVALSVINSEKKAKEKPKEEADEGEPWKTYRLPSTLSPMYNVTLWPWLMKDAASIYTEEKPKEEADEEEPWKTYRLPSTLSPMYYNVTLWPRLVEDDTGIYLFIGSSGVAFTCVQETALILIHAHKLTFFVSPDGLYATLVGMDGTKAPAIKQTWLQVDTQYLVVQLSEKLQVGKTYWLYTEFRGELSDDLKGFYRREYIEYGVKKVAATTHMQPTNARKAFPCFDEPAMKAVFHMTLIHAEGTEAITNAMELDTKKIIQNNKIVLVTSFEPTPKMSTYLLAFVVSEYSYIRTPPGEKVLIRIWAQRKAIEAGQGVYALNITGPILEYFQDYYKSTYPLSKSDQILEPYLLYDPALSTTKDKENVAVMISHELAHMWFGNLVTIKWWNDLWLNEGFATYVSYLGVDKAEPTWNIKDLMVLNWVSIAFTLDALPSSHPLSSPEEEINKPEEIMELFDIITYSKGAAVLRMLSEFLSEEVFAKGLRLYLNQFAYSNTVYSDLWDKLQQEADSDPTVTLPATIKDIMNRWILQRGFPLVTIDTQTGTITQNHFLLPSDKPVRPSIYNYEWFVPIKWMKNGTDMGQYWLLTKTDTHEPMRTNNKWVLANLNVSGFYRVNYDSQNWERLLAQLSSDHTVIPVLNRAQTIDDAFNLASLKINKITLALSTTVYLSEEREYMPWETAHKNLNSLFLLFDQTEVYGLLQKYLKRKVQPLFDHFRRITANWTKIPSSHTDQYCQDTALSLACMAGIEDCSALSRVWFHQWMKNPDQNPIHPNLKTTVYCHAIAASGYLEWNFGWEMYKNATNAAEAEKLKQALACSRNKTLLNRYLKDMLHGEDALIIMGYVAENIVGQSVAWDFIKKNMLYIHFMSYGDPLLTGLLIFTATKRFSTEQKLMELQRFKNQWNLGFTVRLAIFQAIESIKANIKWMAENKEPVKKWLTEQLA